MNVSFDMIEKCYLKIRKNIRNKKIIEEFELLYYYNINSLVDRINSGYVMGRYNIFFIMEKKARLILSNNIYDKIYTHLVSELILSKLDKYLVDSNVATRKNKGVKYARKLLDRYLIEMKNKYDKFYILKLDIKKYFFNINHDILISKLTKYLTSDEVCIIKNIINETNYSYINNVINKINFNNDFSFPIYKYGYGLSIGNVCSQMLAVFYLNDLDHFVKEFLGCKYYIRYMDDIIILFFDKSLLKSVFLCLKEFIINYDLEFNSKSRIYCSYEGFEFLGIRYIIKNNIIKRLINKNIFKKKVSNINKINYKFYRHYFKYLKKY